MYEMCTGKVAFGGSTSAIIFEAILNRAPTPPPQLNPSLPSDLNRILGRALEKDRELRYQTASEIRAELRGLKRDLDSNRIAVAQGTVSATQAVGAVASAAVARKTHAIRSTGLIACAALFVGTGAGWLLRGRWMAVSQPSYHQLTFRRGTIRSAHFTPNGQSVVYGASWEGSPIDLFITSPESPQSRSLNLGGAALLGISSSGEMAVSINSRPSGVYAQVGTLARVPLNGGSPRPVLENVQWADWSPDGNNLAIVRDVGGRNQLEFSIGKVLYQTSGWISHPRVSAKGDLVAFLDHPLPGDDAGSLRIVDLTGKVKTLAAGFQTIQGLAWSADGGEIWFTACELGLKRAIYAATLGGRERLIARVPGMGAYSSPRTHGGENSLASFLVRARSAICRGSTTPTHLTSRPMARSCSSQRRVKVEVRTILFISERLVRPRPCAWEMDRRSACRLMANGLLRVRLLPQPSLFFFPPGRAKPSLSLTTPPITAGRSGFLTASASSSRARNQVALPVFTARIRPTESRCPSPRRESILLFWFSLRMVSRWLASDLMRKHIFTRWQEGTLGLFRVLSLESNPFNGAQTARQSISTSREICQLTFIGWTCRRATGHCGRSLCLPIQPA